MKRLHQLVITSFLGPFVMTFFIVMFILLMQFLWKYIDDLVGKGLDAKVIAELLVYASASLVPLALPLAILLSSLMTFGSMGEFYELTAMKSSGISLQRIMFPLVIFVVFISIGAFFFNNNVMPVTNLKMKSLLFDVRQQRPEIQIIEGVFYNGIDNYSIRVNKKNPVTNMLYDIKIYDHTAHRGNISVTIADSGQMKMTEDKRNMLVTLWNGRTYTEVEPESRGENGYYPERTDVFGKEQFNIALTGFDLSRTDESLFRNSYQMLNITQLQHAEDSLKKEIHFKSKQLYKSLIKNNYFYSGNARRLSYQPFPLVVEHSQSPLQIIEDKSRRNPLNFLHPDTVKKTVKKVSNFDSLYQSFPLEIKRLIINNAVSGATSTQYYVMNSWSNMDYEDKYLRRHLIEWHRKFTLSFACLIFLFIGAPLGAIIRKGGLGMPTVISTLLFILYYIMSMTGEKFAREGMIKSYQGMWLSSVILVVAGVFLTYEATNDSAILNMDTYLNWFRSVLGLKKKKLLDKKAHLTGKFEYIDIPKSQLQDEFRYIIEEGNQCHVKFLNERTIISLNKKLFTNKLYDFYIEFGIHYNCLIDQIVLSKWFRNTYIQKRMDEFPYVDFRLKPGLFSKTYLKVLSVVIIPVYLLRLIFQAVKIRRYNRNVLLIIDLSHSMINLLNRSTLIQEIENWQ